jgi:hypothetical protein
LTLHAPTEGYAPGVAWFLNESPRKAIFETRCGGSSGDCFYYLNLRKSTLEPISDDYFLEEILSLRISTMMAVMKSSSQPAGVIALPPRGAALLKWTGSSYRVW